MPLERKTKKKKKRQQKASRFNRSLMMVGAIVATELTPHNYFTIHFFQMNTITVITILEK